MSSPSTTRSTPDTNGASRVDGAPRRRATETKASFKTTEFFAYLAAVVGVLIAAGVVDQERRWVRRPAGLAVRDDPDGRLHGQPRAREVRQPRALQHRRPLLTRPHPARTPVPRLDVSPQRLEDGSMSQSEQQKQQQKIIQYLGEAHATR